MNMTALLVTARGLAGLLAGVYLGFAVAVMPALRRLDDTTFVTVMNAVNRVIVNPAFLVVFLGAPAAAVAMLLVDRSAGTVAAAVLAALALLITVAGNVPLNDALAHGGHREAFEGPWTWWHLGRTITSVASFLLLCLPR